MPQEDPLEAIFKIEETAYEGGRSAGQVAGRAAGYREGQTAGQAAGIDRCRQLGRIAGRTAVWAVRLSDDGDAPEPASLCAGPDSTAGSGRPLPPLRPDCKTARMVRKLVGQLRSSTDLGMAATRNTEQDGTRLDDCTRRAAATARLLARMVGHDVDYGGKSSASFVAGAEDSASGQRTYLW